MPDDRKKDNEKRNYFRVDDVISVVANPVHLMNEKERDILKSAVGSKAIPLYDVGDSGDGPETEEYSAPPDNGTLYEMLKEVRTKLDFLINHLLLEKEGLISSEKKPVNISASGLRFTISGPVKEKDILEIKLLLPTYPPVAVFAYGEVKRARPLDEQTYEVAIEYLNMGETTRNEIIQYTLNHQRETIRRMKERR